MLAAQIWPHKALLHTDVGQIRVLSMFSCGGFRVEKKKIREKLRLFKGYVNSTHEGKTMVCSSKEDFDKG